jgi:hypothetical protein
VKALRPGLRRTAVIAVVAAIAAIGSIATGGRRGFGVVDEPLYAVNAIEWAGALIDQHPAELDLTTSSHPPFGAQVLALGLLAEPIFPALVPVGGASDRVLCSISQPWSGSPPALISTNPSASSPTLRASGAEVKLAAAPQLCIDLVDRAALLLTDGTLIIAQLVQVDGAERLAISAPVADPAGGWTNLAPAGSEADGALLARSANANWYRIGDIAADEQIAPTGFSGERLLGIGMVGYVDGSTAALTEDDANAIIRLFDACSGDRCDAALRQLMEGRLLLNGDVEPASAGEFSDRLNEIGTVTYGHTRLALGVQGDEVVLLDLDAPENALASIPFKASRLRWTIGSSGREGWQALLATKTRLSTMAVSVFPAPSLMITHETRFNEIVGLYPAGGGSLAAVATAEADGSSRLVLVERTRLRSITGRTLSAPVAPVGEFAVSMNGGRGSLAIVQSAEGEVFQVDTGAAADRLRLMPQAAVIGLATAAAAIGLMVSLGAGLLAGALVLATTLAWEQSRVAMLDGWLAVFIAWQIVAVLLALRTGGRRRLALLAIAGVALGAAAGMKLSGLVIGLPILLVGVAATSLDGASRVTRLLLQLIGALGVLVSGVGVVAGSGLGGMLNLAVSVAMVLIARRGGEARVTNPASLRERASALVAGLGVAGGATIFLLVAPSLVGARVAGVSLDPMSAILLWLYEALRIAEGFTLDHPMALPYWGLVSGLGIGFSITAGPGIFAAMWAAVGTRLPRNSRPTTELIALLFLLALLSVAVWAPLSRILFPWYAAPLVVPVAAALGIAIAQRDRIWRHLPIALAVAPAAAWLAGPTVCLVALSRLDRGCQAISDTSITGTVALVLTTALGAIVVHRISAAVLKGGGIRAYLLESTLLLLLSAVALNISSRLTAPTLAGFQVVVAMELLWGACLAFTVWAWRSGRWHVVALIGGNLMLVELLRIYSGGVPLAPWYLTPTQVGRVIPQPLLHPVPMAVMAIVMLLMLVGAAYIQRRRAGEER